MADSTPARQDVTIADLLGEFGGAWQIENGETCWVAVRRPTLTAQEILCGVTLDELAGKLRVERDRTP